MNKVFRIITIGIICFIAVEVSAQNISMNYFVRNLKLGDSGQDVLQLQKFLNKSADTQIAVSGLGSIGNESTYFGALTKNAVMRFQNKFQSEILTPSGLASPTGFVGPATIKKINSLIASTNNISSNVPAQTNQNNSNQTTANQNKMPLISAVSKVAISVGDILIINGKFYGTPSVHFGDTDATNFTKVSATEIDAVVPNISGAVMVWVGDQYGDTRADFPMFVIAGNVSSDILDKISAQNNIIHNKALDPRNQ